MSNDQMRDHHFQARPAQKWTRPPPCAPRPPAPGAARANWALSLARPPQLLSTRQFLKWRERHWVPPRAPRPNPWRVVRGGSNVS